MVIHGTATHHSSQVNKPQTTYATNSEIISWRQRQQMCWNVNFTTWQIHKPEENSYLIKLKIRGHIHTTTISVLLNRICWQHIILWNRLLTTCVHKLHRTRRSMSLSWRSKKNKREHFISYVTQSIIISNPNQENSPSKDKHMSFGQVCCQYHDYELAYPLSN